MSDNPDDPNSDPNIIAEARQRYAYAESWEGSARMLGMEDEKFGNADADNGWQWPITLKGDREAENLPCLTINKTRQHCLQIINDLRDHEDGVQVRPVGGGASFAGAQAYEGLIRHTEYISNAQQAYDTGVWHQVFSGIGYWRVVTDFMSDDSFDQEIYIRRVPNPRSVYLDPDIKEYDGSDARWGIVFEDKDRKVAIAEGLIEKDDISTNPLGNDGDSWNTKGHVRIAEYFRRVDKADELIELPPDMAAQMGRSTIRRSEIPAGVRRDIPKEFRRRKITTPEIEWFKIVADKIVSRKPWPGKYVPIVRIVGEETVIDGILDRKGHVRALKDPQRMYNYNSSASVQYGALQSKTPWLAPIESIGAHMDYWSAANIATAAVLPYNHLSAEGDRELPAPRRIEPPAAAPVFLEGMKIAQQELMLASGQYQAVMGAPSNETSGKAINARQRQGDNATGHYPQHRATAIRFTGKILIDLYPKIYDTERVRQIIARDGSRSSVRIDPNAPAAHQSLADGNDKDADKDAVTAIFNPAVGQYDVMSDVGPSYATARQEAFNAFSQIISQEPAAFNLLGDLWLENADFPNADKGVERLKAMLPPQATGGPSKEVQAMHQHMQAAAKAGQDQIEQLHQALQEARQKLSDRGDDAGLERYKAATARLKVLADADPEGIKPVLRTVLSDAMGSSILEHMAAHAGAEQAMLPPEPVEAAPDGQ